MASAATRPVHGSAHEGNGSQCRTTRSQRRGPDIVVAFSAFLDLRLRSSLGGRPGFGGLPAASKQPVACRDGVGEDRIIRKGDGLLGTVETHCAPCWRLERDEAAALPQEEGKR